MRSSSSSATNLRHDSMNGVLPGPTNARAVTRGNTSPGAMARSEIVPIVSPVASTTGFPMRRVRYSMGSPLSAEQLGEDGLDDEQERQADHDDGRAPRDHVEGAAVDVLAHQLLVVDEDEDVDEDERQERAVDDLRPQHDLEQRDTRDQDDPGAHNDQHREEPVECRGLAPLLVEACLETERLAYVVRSGERQDGGSEQR